jgi:hypothetical protein
MIVETKLVERVLEKLDAEDKRAIEIMSGGNLTDWGQYQRSAGYRKALADCKTLLNETLEDILKE